jgi:hypothetical protein
MGRGRQKAKATRVARDLKYSGPEMDLDRLAKELHGESTQPAGATPSYAAEDDPYEDDTYAKRA